MVSRMDSICERYAAGCTKTSPKILQVKRGQNSETHPIQPEKGETGCVLGAGGGGSGWRRMRADGKGRSEQGRGGRLLLSLAKMEGRTCLACWLGQLAAERHWRSLAPRHAVLEWMWESAPGRGKRPMSSGSHRKSQRGRCWFGAASYFWRRIVYRLPLLPSKEKHLRQEDGQADQDHGRVGPGSVQLRHRVEIHAVPTSN